MNDQTAHIAENAAARLVSAEPDFGASLSRDIWLDGCRAAALAAALLLHAGVFALLLVKLTAEEPSAEPPTIPVELVSVPEPQPKAKPEPQPTPQVYRESGGDPDRAPGRSSDAAIPAHRELAPEPRPATPVQPAEASGPSSPTEPAARPLPVASPVPPPPRPPAQARTQSVLRGEGGGNRYLNAVRDDILRNRIYPSLARSLGLVGTAEYELIVDRQGHLLQVRLLRSSGARILDQAGLEAIELSAPLRPLPPDIAGDTVGMVLVLYIGP